MYLCEMLRVVGINVVPFNAIFNYRNDLNWLIVAKVELIHNRNSLRLI